MSSFVAYVFLIMFLLVCGLIWWVIGVLLKPLCRRLENHGAGKRAAIIVFAFLTLLIPLIWVNYSLFKFLFEMYLTSITE